MHLVRLGADEAPRVANVPVAAQRRVADVSPPRIGWISDWISVCKPATDEHARESLRASRKEGAGL
jgi:hypothetical protein